MDEKTLDIFIALMGIIWGIIGIVFRRAFGRATGKFNERLHLPRNDRLNEICFAIAGLAFTVFGILALLGII